MAECAAFGAANEEVGVWGGEVRSTKGVVTVYESVSSTLQIQDARPKRI